MVQMTLVTRSMYGPIRTIHGSNVYSRGPWRLENALDNDSPDTLSTTLSEINGILNGRFGRAHLFRQRDDRERVDDAPHREQVEEERLRVSHDARLGRVQRKGHERQSHRHHHHEQRVPDHHLRLVGARYTGADKGLWRVFQRDARRT